MDETQKNDTEKQTETPSPADNKYNLTGEMNLRLELLGLRTEVNVIGEIILDLLKRKDNLKSRAETIQERLDGQQSFFEEASGGDAGSAVQDNQQ